MNYILIIVILFFVKQYTFNGKIAIFAYKLFV